MSLPGVPVSSACASTPARSGPDVCTDHCIPASSGFSFAFPFVHFVSFVVPLSGLGLDPARRKNREINHEGHEEREG
jgi:hypothetical protein